MSRPVYPDLAGRSAVVTGGAQGVGLAIADRLASAGVSTLLLDTNADLLETARQRLSESYPDVVIASACASVTDQEAVVRALGDFAEHTGSLDVVVNNAGIAANESSLELDLATWRRAIDVNLTGVFVCSQAGARLMLAHGGGVIINIASMFGVISAARRAAYCAAKAGVVSLTKVLAVEWASSGVRVNAIGPGYVETSLVAELASAGKLELDELERRTPRGTLASPSDIAELALFLASDVSRNITGQAVITDGGWTADGYGVSLPARTAVPAEA